MSANIGKARTPKCSFRRTGSCVVPCAGEQLLLHQHYSSSGSEDDGRDDEEEEGGGPPVQVRQPIAVVAVAEFVRTPYSRPRSAWGSRLEQSESEIESALEDNNWLRHEMDEKKVVVEDLKDAAFSLDETLLVVAGPDHRVCVYDVASGESVHEFDACKGTVVNCVAISPSSKIIFTGGQDGILKAWDATAPNLTLLRKLRHPKAVKSCATNQALPPRGYSAIYREGGAEGRVAESAAESDGNVAGAEAEAGVGDGSGGNNGSFDGARRAQTDNGSINSHNTIMDGGENEEDEEKETETEKEKEKDGSGSGGHGGGDDVDDGMVATGCADGRIRIWNCGGDWVLMHTIVHGCSVQSLAFSSNGAKVVSGGFDWRVKVWDWATDAANAHDGSIAAVPTQLCAHRGSISALAFSNKGDIVASGSRDTTCRLWPLSGTDVPSFAVLRAHLNWVRVCCFSKEDDSFASACDELICIWGVGSGTLLRVFPAYMHMTHTCIFSRSTGQLVVAGGVDLDANPPRASEEDQGFERQYGFKLAATPILISEVDGVEALTLTRRGAATPILAATPFQGQTD